MRLFFKSILPRPIWQGLRWLYWRSLAIRYRMIGHPRVEAETTRARARREREGFYEAYFPGTILDVGHGGDKILPRAQGWDFEDGDAQYLKGIADESFDTVYSSHTIEHMVDAGVSIANWWRVVRPGGYLVLYLPHRDLYEKKLDLPSRWNHDHKHFFLPDRDEPPVTIGLRPLLERTLPGAELIYLKECAEGHTITDPLVHSDGEYSIEAVLRKPMRA